jgi:hypothetical protein
MSTLLGTQTIVFIYIKASIKDAISPISPSTTASRVVMGKILTRMSPFSEILLGIN